MHRESAKLGVTRENGVRGGRKERKKERKRERERPVFFAIHQETITNIHRFSTCLFIHLMHDNTRQHNFVSSHFLSISLQLFGAIGSFLSLTFVEIKKNYFSFQIISN